MRTFAIVSVLALGLGLLSGCTTASGGATGGLIGGLTGAGIGAIAGDPTAGALIGAGLGLGAGALIGSENQRMRRQEGWVYDDIWGASGHRVCGHSGGCSHASQPTAYQPTAYRPAQIQQTSARYRYTPEYPDRILYSQPQHYWDHY